MLLNFSLRFSERVFRIGMSSWRLLYRVLRYPDLPDIRLCCVLNCWMAVSAECGMSSGGKYRMPS